MKKKIKKRKLLGKALIRNIPEWWGMALVPSNYLRNTKSISMHIIWLHLSLQSYDKKVGSEYTRTWWLGLKKFLLEKLYDLNGVLSNHRPCVAMDSASDFESKGRRIKSQMGQKIFSVILGWIKRI